MSITRAKPDRASIRRLRANLQVEVDSEYLYDTLARLEPQPELAEVYHQLAASERRHAAHWREMLTVDGDTSGAVIVSRRARILAALANRFGPGIILPTLAEAERAMSETARVTKSKLGLPVSGLENTHGAILATMQNATAHGVEGGVIARFEGRHRAVGGNALRAAVLGANDGLVSNLSLVMGVAGASKDTGPVLIAGLAGLLAGALSMALGEWLSVQSARELNARQVEIEREELELAPEEEAQELALIYQAKGLPQDEALALAHKLLSGDRKIAIATLAGEELGLDPEELGGSAWEAAATSLLLFGTGAMLPVIPFLFLQSSPAVAASLVLSALGLFGIGAAITLLTGRSVWFSGLRQVLFGLGAAALTFGIGRLVGANLTG